MKTLSWFLSLMLLAVPLQAQQKFSELVGHIEIGPVKAGPIDVPYLSWGADVAEFLANGSATKTMRGSINDSFGLSLNLVNGDDFPKQVQNYMSGKTPFIRGTFDQLGQASGVICSDPRTKPKVIVQLSWSAGDHIVARDTIKNLNGLIRTGKKVRVAVQQGGPHVGLIYAVLQSLQASKDQIEIVWVKDLMGDKGPAALMRKDPTIDAACVVTPDMIGLCGGIDQTGTDSEGNIKGSHVIVSTATMSRAIPDVWAVRSDWYEQNKPVVDKFVAAYLKGCEQLVVMRKQFNDTNKLTPEYKAILTMAQSAMGKEFLPTLEVDAHGLLLDSGFAGLQGQMSFFTDKGNLNGYEAKAKNALNLALDWGYSDTTNSFSMAELDYEAIAKMAGIKYEAIKITPRIVAETIDFSPEANLDDKTIFSFTISFESNSGEFAAEKYVAEFQRAVKAASDFGNAVVVIRGHADPTKTLQDLVKAGIAKGTIKRTGTDAKNYEYFYDGKKLDLTQTAAITKAIQNGSFDGVNPSPRETMQAALNLSQQRADVVRNSIIAYARKQGSNLDISQMKPVGAGINEPVVAKPTNLEEAKKNMRVEFRILRVPAEAIKQSDFEY